MRKGRASDRSPVTTEPGKNGTKLEKEKLVIGICRSSEPIRKMLVAIRNWPGLTEHEIADLLCVCPCAATGMLRKLMDAGLVFGRRRNGDPLVYSIDTRYEQAIDSLLYIICLSRSRWPALQAWLRHPALNGGTAVQGNIR